MLTNVQRGFSAIDVTVTGNMRLQDRFAMMVLMEIFMPENTAMVHRMRSFQSCWNIPVQTRSLHLLRTVQFLILTTWYLQIQGGHGSEHGAEILW